MKNIFGIIGTVSLLFIGNLTFPVPALAKIQSFTIQRNVQKTDGNRIVTTTINLRRTQTNEIMRNSNDLKYLVQNLIEKAKSYLGNFRSQTSNKYSQRSQLSDISRQARERARDAMDRQKMLREAQESRIQDLRERAKNLMAIRRTERLR